MKDVNSVCFVPEDFKTPEMCTDGGSVWDCVAVAIKDGVVAVKDTKNPDQSELRFTAQEWQNFTTAVKAGSFDIV